MQNKTMKKLMTNAVSAVELGYRLVRGIDYETLSRYILQINRHRDITAILFEVSQCLKEILGYELFGFSMKRGSSLELWIDPRMYNTAFKDHAIREFGGQNIDCTIHNFEKDDGIFRQNIDGLDINDLISYPVINGSDSARLYILPKKRMLFHHAAIINTIISSIAIALEKNLSIEQLESAAAIDPLTGCYNRRALDSFIENDIAYAKRHSADLSVIMIDLDNFKEINDAHGHLAGDAVLRELSRLVPSLVRKSDYVARYGGEEFVIVLPGSSLYNAVQLAHMIKKSIEQHAFPHGDAAIWVTASFGVASLENKAEGGSLLREADERLYRAKSAGKNSVVPSLLPFFADKNFVSRKPAAVPSSFGHLA